jgi:hypothetical protein
MSTYSPRLKKTYKETVVPALQKEFKYKSSYAGAPHHEDRG